MGLSSECSYQDSHWQIGAVRQTQEKVTLLVETMSSCEQITSLITETHVYIEEYGYHAMTDFVYL